MPPTPLAIATASVNRLLKEESTYRTELASQEQRIGKMKAARGDGAEGENAKWELRQEVCILMFFLALLFFRVS